MSTEESSGRLLLRRFDGAAERNPAAVAVRAGGTCVTYGELAAASRELAVRLAPLTAGRPGPVAVLVPPGPGQVCAALAAMRCGKPYLPVDPAYPRERVERILADAAPSAVAGPPEDAARDGDGDRNRARDGDEYGDGGGLRADGVRVSAGRWGDGPVTGDGDAYVIYTSGSTGRPKGIAVGHDGIVNMLDDLADRRRIPPRERYSTCASPGFDAAVLETWSALIAGGELVVTPDACRWHPAEFARWLADESIAHAYIPAAFLPALAEGAEGGGGGLDLSALQRVIVAVEPIPRGLLGRIKRALPGLTLLNGYGPTEAAVCVSVYEVSEADDGPERAPIGTAIRNTELVVEPLPGDEGGVGDEGDEQAVAGGESADGSPDAPVGELHIGGVGVGRYLRPEPGAEPAFSTRTDADGTGRRYFRTGDVVRADADGVLTFLRRRDHMIKVRGYRVEPGDVEHALLDQPGVGQAVVLKHVLDRPAPEGSSATAVERLIAHVVPESGGRVDVGAVQRALRDRLPWYAVPHRVLVRDAFPMTVHGKTDRKALLADPRAAEAPASGSAAETASGSAAGTAAETTSGTAAGTAAGTPQEERPRHGAHVDPALAELWYDALGDGAGPGSSFLEAGGDSLAAGRLAAGIARRLARRVPVMEILLAEDLDALQAAVGRAPEGTVDGLPPLRARRPGEEVPATWGQRGLWFHDELHPGSPVYNEPLTLRLRGALDVTALSRALDTLVERHEALRTGLVLRDGRLVQDIRPFTPLGLTVQALPPVPDEERTAEEERRIREFVRRPFDLAAGPQLRALLLRCGDREHLLSLCVHHSAFDGGSADTLFAELSALYAAYAEGQTPEPGRLRPQYADFALRQHALAEGGHLDGDIAYWRERLAGLPERIDLPADFPRPATPSGEGALVRARLPRELTDRVDALARDAGTTRYTLLLAAFQTLLARYCGTDEVTVGVPFSGRDVPETEGIVGYCLNTLPLYGDLRGEPSFRELLTRTRRAVADAYTHQRAPYGLVLERTGGAGAEENPRLQVCLVPEDVYRHEMAFGGLTSSFEYVDPGIAKFDLTVNLIPDGGGPEAGSPNEAGGLRLTAEYRTDLFRASTVERLLGHFRTLLESATGAPDTPAARLEMLTEPERALLLGEFAGETVPDADGTGALGVHGLVDRRARQTPDAPALTLAESGVRLTYRELTGRADRLAHYLAERGAEPGARVGVRLPRGVDAVVAFLAVLKTGSAYVPLDPDYPAERLAFMARDAALVLEIDAALLRRDADAIAASPARPPTVAVRGDDAAYVIYTSGSTGRPKGVPVPHRAVADLALCAPRWTGVGAGSRLLQLASLSFDLATFDLWATLVNGAELVLPPPGTVPPQQIAAYLAGHDVTHGDMPTALFHRQAEYDPASTAGLRTLLVGGEVLDPAPAAKVLDASPGLRLVNAYGPTEATAYSTYHVLTGPEDVTSPLPIGRPTPNTRVRILDRNGQPVPVGVVGELHLGGPGLALGYLGRDALTAERFVPDPLGGPGELLFATGDSARWLPDGAVAYAGRRDEQVKVQGYRVEPGEVEAALRAHPGVEQAVVVRREDRPGGPYLAAYYTAGGTEEVAPAELEKLAAERLPASVVPQAYTELEHIPVTTGGKTDRDALPVPEVPTPAGSPAAGGGPARDAADVPAEVAAIWRDVLGLDELGPDQRLFDVGGTSLQVTLIHQRVAERLGLSRLRVVDLFGRPTLRTYTALVQRLYDESRRGERV